MVTGWIRCHCGQDVPGALADSHVKPNGVTCVGIREYLHKPGICLECREGTHRREFLDMLETIRWEKGITVPGGGVA